MDLESVILREALAYDILYMWNPRRNVTNELTYKTETDSETSRMSLWLPGRRVRGRGHREFEMSMYTLLYLKWTTNKDLFYHTGNST